jgi:hypothetical protein
MVWCTETGVLAGWGDRSVVRRVLETHLVLEMRKKLSQPCAIPAEPRGDFPPSSSAPSPPPSSPSAKPLKEINLSGD